ncbi:hypothetical protein [Klebsiella pneumoniae ISC21]|nr:hypothetical protein [Klebsiella pneumoniae ISC21]
MDTPLGAEKTSGRSPDALFGITHVSLHMREGIYLTDKQLFKPG